MNDSAASKFAVPLLRDRHTHPFLYASWIDGINIHDLDSKAKVLQRISQSQTTAGEVLVVQGWLDSKLHLNESDLKSFGPTAVFNLSLHGVVMNNAAKSLVEEQLGYTGNWSDQIWYERNMRPILNAFAMLNGNVDRLKRYFKLLRDQCGVIYAEEMLLAGEKEIDVFHEAGLIERTRFWCSYEMFQTLSENAKQLIHGMKIFADGALGVRTAAVNMPYDNGDHGLLMYRDEELESLVEKCIATEKAIAIHAIGDKAIDQVVNLISRLQQETGFQNEVRIEHAQLISKPTACLAKDAKITLSMQPNFSIDSVEYSDRLPEPYLRGNNPFRMLIDEIGFVPGEDLILGSDGMPPGVSEAIRQSLSPPFPNQQRLTIQEFIAGYCDKSVFANDEKIEVALADY